MRKGRERPGTFRRKAVRRPSPRAEGSDRTASEGAATGGAHAPAAGQGWDHVAAWYDRLVGDEGSDYHQHLIVPAALRLLDPRPGERFLDVCCGQGVFSRLLLERKAELVVGVDASRRLIDAARSRGPADPKLRYEVRDARNLGNLADGRFDGAACIMAAQDVENIAAVFGEMARSLHERGRAVVVMMHPCFRVPRQSSWGWDEQNQTQYRRLDRYASPLTIPIHTHPGRGTNEHTLYYHRPLADYVNALGSAGLATVAVEELYSHRQPPRGARHRAISRSAREFPLFLAAKARKMT